MTKTVHIIVSGKVQGVCYRASTQKKAISLKLNGRVKNLPDGSVEIQAQGEIEAIEQLIAWCHQGPLLAKVKQVLVTDIDTLTLGPGFFIT